MTNPVETAVRGDLQLRASRHAIAQKTNAVWIEACICVLEPADRLIKWGVVARLQQGLGADRKGR